MNPVKKIHFEIQKQPDDISCGPTSLHAVYRYYGDRISLSAVIGEVPRLESGGTLAVMLAIHALKRNYRATILTYNLQMFDPSWFRSGKIDLHRRLQAQAKAKSDAKLHAATRSYLEFLDLGGAVLFEDLDVPLLSRYLDRSIPILTGLSATYLYREARQRGWDDADDDIRGEPTGHFVVLTRYDHQKEQVIVADPLHTGVTDDPGLYAVGVRRLINSILLGVLTYDGNMLVLEPGS